MKIVTSPAFKASLKDLESVLIGFLLMTLGTVTTGLIDVLVKWLGGLDLSSVTVYGLPVLMYLVPIVTALLNFIRKYVTETKYIK